MVCRTVGSQEPDDNDGKDVTVDPLKLVSRRSSSSARNYQPVNSSISRACNFPGKLVDRGVRGNSRSHGNLSRATLKVDPTKWKLHESCETTAANGGALSVGRVCIVGRVDAMTSPTQRLTPVSGVNLREARSPRLRSVCCILPVLETLLVCSSVTSYLAWFSGEESRSSP